MADLTEYERQRQANIAANKALLQELNLDKGPAAQGFVTVKPTKGAAKAKKAKDGPKPVQPRKSAGKRKAEEEAGSDEGVTTRRLSTRFRRSLVVGDDPKSIEENKKAETEYAAKLEAERLENKERQKQADLPRHQDLELETLAESEHDKEEQATLLLQFSDLRKLSYPKKVAEPRALKTINSEKDKLEKEMQNMTVVARAKVTRDRIYSAAYHPDKTKDLIFFGDRHGQLGIWDARATQPEEEEDSNEDGVYWRLQPHWPAKARSSISCVAFDPVDCHSVYTSSYDSTIRRTSFVSGVSTELYATDQLISGFDFRQNGNEMWISDNRGGVTYLDLRQSRHSARRYQLTAKEKIGCVSLNPVDDWSLLASSNDRTLKLWDSRQLMAIPSQGGEIKELTSALVDPEDIEHETVENWIADKDYTMRGSWSHGYSVTSAYWDPSGTKILSTCYDNKLRVWDLPQKYLLPDEPLETFRPKVNINHNCETGAWVTVFKAQWTRNPDVYPYFSVGDMDRSLKIFSGDGDLLADLRDDEKITAVQAVTVTHPSVPGRAASGNASGRCVLWST